MVGKVTRSVGMRRELIYGRQDWREANSAKDSQDDMTCITCVLRGPVPGNKTKSNQVTNQNKPVAAATSELGLVRV